MVNAVHEGYIARLSLDEINVLSKPLLRPGWHKVLHHKCTEAGIQFRTTGPSKMYVSQDLTKML